MAGPLNPQWVMSKGPSAFIFVPTILVCTSSTTVPVIAGGDGGGIWARNLSLTACTFTGNTSVGSGGAVRHAADWNRPDDVLTVEQCQFSDNKAGDETHTDRSGGAIWSTGAGMELKNITFQNNQATSSGGAVYRSSNSTGCTSTVEMCTFVENAATIPNPVIKANITAGSANVPLGMPVYVVNPTAGA